jgi:hypothetical protein
LNFFFNLLASLDGSQAPAAKLAMLWVLSDCNCEIPAAAAFCPVCFLHLKSNIGEIGVYGRIRIKRIRFKHRYLRNLENLDQIRL